MMRNKIAILTTLISLCALAQVKLGVEPPALSGIPGEVLRVELTIETEIAVSAELRVPRSSNLVVRAVESYPVVKSPEGRFIQKKSLLVQGVEAGLTVMTNLLLEIQGEASLFPPVTIEVRAVQKADPPVNKLNIEH